MTEVFTTWSYPLCIAGTIATLTLCFIFLTVYNSPRHWDFLVSNMWGSNMVSPFVLGVFRIVSFIYLFCTLTSFLVITTFVNLRFYTTWNYLLLTIYFAIGSWYSLRAFIFFKRHGHFHSLEEIGALGNIFIVLHQLCCTMTILVDIILWGVMLPLLISTGSPTDDIFNFWSYTQHAINFIFVLIEFLFCQLPWHKLHSLFALIWAGYYIIFSWIYYEFEAVWAYPFLEPRVWTAPLWYLGLAICHVLFFFVWYLFFRLRDRKYPLKLESPSLSGSVIEHDPLKQTN